MCLDFITVTIFGEVYKLRSSSLCNLFQPPATSFLLGPNTFKLYSSLSVRDQVSHPYKTPGKIRQER
jgi:hypothetical protein